MTTRHISEMIKKYTKKRYGKKNDRMVSKYTEMAQKMYYIFPIIFMFCVNILKAK